MGRMFVYRASYELGTLSTWFYCCVTVFLFSEPTENDHGVKRGFCSSRRWRYCKGTFWHLKTKMLICFLDGKIVYRCFSRAAIFTWSSYQPHLVKVLLRYITPCLRSRYHDGTRLNKEVTPYVPICLGFLALEFMHT